MGCSFTLAVDVVLPDDEGLPLGVDELLDCRVILIEPVLVFPSFIAKDAFAEVSDGGLEHAPVCFNVFWIFLGQFSTESSLKLLSGGGVTQPFDVELWPALSFFHPSFPHEMDGHSGANEAVVCPTVICTSHRFGVEHITMVFGADNYVVNEVPGFRTRMHPGCFGFVLLAEKCVGDD